MTRGDIQRISRWLAEDVNNQEAQGASSDLNAALDVLDAYNRIVQLVRGGFSTEHQEMRDALDALACVKGER